MIPPVFITLNALMSGKTPHPTTYQVQHILGWAHSTARQGTTMLVLALETSGPVFVAETPEEIDELIRKATEPYTAALHRLFTPAYHVHTNF